MVAVDSGWLLVVIESQAGSHASRKDCSVTSIRHLQVPYPVPQAFSAKTLNSERKLGGTADGGGDGRS